LATKKRAGEGGEKPQGRTAAKESAAPRATPKKTAVKAAKAGRPSTPSKRPATPRIRASHSGVAEPGRADRVRRGVSAGDEMERRARPIPADRPAAPRARRPAREDVELPAARSAREGGELPQSARPARTTEAGGPAKLPPTGRALGRKTPLAGPKRAGARRSVPPAPQPSAVARDLALALAAAGLDKKAIGVEILEVVGRVDYADYLVIMTGRSDRHVHAIATGLEEATRKTKTAPLSIEGLTAASWVLIDYGDVVVHVFQEEARRLYDIEGLWIDAGRVPMPDDGAGPSAQDGARPDPS
jgi:ribosome-associated protein